MADFNALTGDLKTDNMLEMLKTIILEENVFKKINILDIVIIMMDDATKEKLPIKKYRDFVKNLKADKELVKLLTFHSHIVANAETALEYFGRDYISNPEFIYNAEFVDQLDKINGTINQFIGEILRELTDTSIDF